jgi:hypothetical protein
MRDENGLDLADPAWRERCDFCGWPLGDRKHGCAEPDDCSQRPRPHNDLTTWKQEIRRLEAALAERTRERDEARSFGEKAAHQYNALLEDSKKHVLTCAFCGHEYPPGTPPTQHEALTAHVKVCEKHPLAAELARLREKAEAIEKLEEWLRDVAGRHASMERWSFNAADALEFYCDLRWDGWRVAHDHAATVNAALLSALAAAKAKKGGRG